MPVHRWSSSLPSGAELAWSSEKFQEFLSDLRPTTRVPSLGTQHKPLRVIDAKYLCDTKTVRFVQPQQMDSVVSVSHTWSQTAQPWEAARRPFPAADEPMIVKGFSLKGLCRAAQLVLERDFKYFWVDSVCIDQASRLEKQREINSMGAFYRHSAECLIFPGGLDDLVKPLTSKGHLPRCWLVLCPERPRIALKAIWSFRVCKFVNCLFRHRFRQS